MINMEAVQTNQSEREDTMRKVLFDTFCQQYHALSTFIQKLPIHPEMKGKISFFMDTAFLWTKESFVMQEAEAKRAALAAVPDEQQPATETTAESETVAATA
jgi:hypothetical protein